MDSFCIITGRQCYSTAQLATKDITHISSNNKLVRCCLYCSNWHIITAKRNMIIRKGGPQFWWWFCLEHSYGDGFMSWTRTMESVSIHLRMDH